MMTLQKKSKTHTLMCLSVISALIFMFVGCEDAADTTPPTPNAPTNLTATAGNGEVALKWTAPTGGAAVSQYHIYRAEGDSIDGATRLTSTTSATITGTSYTDLTAVNGTEYSYAVRAVSANGTESGNSNTDTATPLLPAGAPSSLVATAASGSVSLTWTAPMGGGTVNGYRIYRAMGDGAFALLPTAPATLTSDTRTHTDSTVTNGTAYRYVVRAVDGGAESAASETATAIPLAPPGAPTNLTANAGNGMVMLNWTAPAPATDTNVVQYYIYRVAGTDINTATRLSPTNPGTIMSTTYTDTSTVNGTQYSYAVRGVNANGAESENSNTATATPLLPAGAPSSLVATATSGSVSLTWTAPMGGGTVNGYRIYRAMGDGAFALLPTAPATLTSDTRTHTDSTVTNGTTYRYTVRAVNESDTESPNSDVTAATPLAPPGAPTSLTAIAGVGMVILSWTAPATDTNVVQYYIYRVAGTNINTATRLSPTNPGTIMSTTYTDTSAVNGTAYSYAVRAVNANDAESANSPSASTTPRALDSDNDTLIDIWNLDMLAHIRYNLAGTSYKTSDSDSGLQCGMDGTTACTGYELMTDLDFAAAGDYASGSVNLEWRPTMDGSVVAPGSATNSGWQPIGDRTTRLATLFEGNGRSISNLYSRNANNIHQRYTGLFGQLGSGTLRNLLIEDGNVYGGSRNDIIGIAVGFNTGTITNIAVRGGSARGGSDSDAVGGLVGFNQGTIVASSVSTTAVYGDSGVNESIGGLVGELNAGSVIASYASGAVDGGTGDNGRVGGLVGRNQSTIRASYATGNVDGGAGANDNVGGLVGEQYAGTTILASYALGNVDGGAGTGDGAGKLTGSTAGTITVSYGFGTTSGGETAGSDGTTLPAGATTAPQLTIPVAMNPPTTATPATWNQATSITLNAWDFGSNTQAPALRYADYDGTGGTDYCAAFTNVPGTTTAISCGTTLLPGQR